MMASQMWRSHLRRLVQVFEHKRGKHLVAGYTQEGKPHLGVTERSIFLYSKLVSASNSCLFCFRDAPCDGVSEKNIYAPMGRRAD